MERKAMNDCQVKDIEDVFGDPINTNNEFYSTMPDEDENTSSEEQEEAKSDNSGAEVSSSEEDLVSEDDPKSVESEVEVSSSDQESTSKEQTELDDTKNVFNKFPFIIGKKIGCTNIDAQKQINVNEPFYGNIISIYTSKSNCILDSNNFLQKK